MGLNVPGSPYAINFTSIVPESSGMIPMNISAYSCSDTSLGCSCGDCPSPTCSSSAAPSISKRSTCSFKMGSVEVKTFKNFVQLIIKKHIMKSENMLSNWIHLVSSMNIYLFWATCDDCRQNAVILWWQLFLLYHFLYFLGGVLSIRRKKWVQLLEQNHWLVPPVVMVGLQLTRKKGFLYQYVPIF